MQRIKDIRNEFIRLKNEKQFVLDKTGCRTLELVGATFIADEPAIFGTVNIDYANREIDWYKSMSLNVNDIKGDVPKAWQACASSKGLINSNYGYLVWHEANFNQYERVREELKKNRDSRRAVMIYTRPSIWTEYNVDGMSDFICTNAVQYLIRNDRLMSVVQMRSNDTIYGFKNDKFWQDYVHAQLADDLGVERGDMIWHVGSLHVYERHFDLIKENNE